MVGMYLTYCKRMVGTALTGSPKYFAWIASLLLVCFIGLFYYYLQLQLGLITTNLTDEVSWGAYIANFTYLVGVADAAVLLVVAAYVYNHEAIKEVVLLGVLLAFSALLMCLLFIMVDLGRPDRFWHLLPFVGGRLNFPQSILAWDVVALNGYVLLNMHIPGYLLFSMYRGKAPNPKYYLPFIFLSIFWGVCLHTVTAFLYSGLGGRPFWNAAILAPRFLVGAFTCGSAILILTFTAINKCYKSFTIKEEVFSVITRIIAITMPLNLFLLFCELFKEFYTDSTHVASAEYLYFGLHGHNMLVPYIWAAIACNIFSAVVYTTRLRDQRNLLLFACLVTIYGTWVEKGMGLIIPAFIPSSLGDIVEYTPSACEFWISLAIWAFGTLVFTINAKICIAIITGKLREKSAPALTDQRD